MAGLVATEPGKGSAYQPRGGMYYMQVNAMGTWKIQVVILPEM